MHPCAECGNYQISFHTNDRTMDQPCSCYPADDHLQPTGEQRRVKNLAAAHHCVLGMLNITLVQGRPGAKAFISEVSDCLEASDATNAIYPVVQRMETEFLRQVLSGAPEKVVIGSNLIVECGNQWHDNFYWHHQCDVSNTVWAVEADRRHLDGNAFRRWPPPATDREDRGDRGGAEPRLLVDRLIAGTT